MSEPLTIFSSTTGLNTKIDPARIKFDPASGLADLAVAVNVDIDSTGRIGRRKGFAATARTEDIHSLWCDGGACLFATGTSLCLLAADFSYITVASITANAPISYFELAGQSYCL